MFAGVFYLLVATLLLVFVLRVLNKVFPRLQRLVRLWQRSRIHALRVQRLELISAERIGRLIGGLITMVRLVATLIVLYVYLLLAFSFFPWTRGVASRLVQYAVEPVVAVLQAFVAYVPHMFYIVVILIAVRHRRRRAERQQQALRTASLSLGSRRPLARRRLRINE